MKIDLVRTIVAICIGVLIGWGFYAMAQDTNDGLPLGFAIGIETALLGVGLVGIKYDEIDIKDTVASKAKDITVDKVKDAAIDKAKNMALDKAEGLYMGKAMFTLFRELTGEDWTDLRYNHITAYEYGYIKASPTIINVYHISWFILAAFLLLNLVTGAILNNYQLVMEYSHDEKKL